MIFICSALGDLRKTMLLSLFNKTGISILQNARYKIFANVLPKKGHIPVSYTHLTLPTT